MLSAKLDRFQSTLTERVYRATVLNIRALNVLSLLTACQAELFEHYGQTHNLTALKDVPIITDLCQPMLRSPGFRESAGHHGATGAHTVVDSHQPLRQRER